MTVVIIITNRDTSSVNVVLSCYLGRSKLLLFYVENIKLEISFKYHNFVLANEKVLPIPYVFYRDLKSILIFVNFRETDTLGSKSHPLCQNAKIFTNFYPYIK